MAVMLKRQMLKNPFFVQFRLILSYVAIVKKESNKENSDFLIFNDKFGTFTHMQKPVRLFKFILIILSSIFRP